MKTGIYVIENRENGRRYVGSAVNIPKRWREHQRALGQGSHHSRFLQRSWNKQRAEDFEFKVILICAPACLLRYEQACIDFYKPAYNSAPTAGSQLGYRHRDETKAKMAEAARRTRNFTGHKHSEASKSQISKAKKGVSNGPLAEATREKIRQKALGRTVPPEVREKIAESLRGRKQDPAVVEKRRLGNLGNTWSDEQRASRLPGIERMRRKRARLSDAQVAEIKKALAGGERQGPIALRYGVDRSVISEINTGKTYDWVRA